MGYVLYIYACIMIYSLSMSILYTYIHCTHTHRCIVCYIMREAVLPLLRSPGRITETFIQDFTALGGAGQLYVLVQNTGTVTSDYAVRVFVHMYNMCVL